MLKQIFDKDILLVILANVFADVTWLVSYYSMLLIIIGISENDILFFTLFAIIILFTIGRITIIPVVYDNIMNKLYNNVVQKKIYLLKSSKTAKIVITILLTIISILINIEYGKNLKKIIIPEFIATFITGILGSYIFLFLYWYIKDKFKENHFIQKLLNIMINKYTCISSVIAILLGYIAIAIMVFTSNFNKI